MIVLCLRKLSQGSGVDVDGSDIFVKVVIVVSVEHQTVHDALVQEDVLRLKKRNKHKGVIGNADVFG